MKYKEREAGRVSGQAGRARGPKARGAEGVIEIGMDIRVTACPPCVADRYNSECALATNPFVFQIFRGLYL